MKNDRREFLKKSSSLAAALSIGGIGASSASALRSTVPQKVKWPLLEGPDTPKLTLNSSPNGYMKALLNRVNAEV